MGPPRGGLFFGATGAAVRQSLSVAACDGRNASKPVFCVQSTVILGLFGPISAKTFFVAERSDYV
jgi:hypothetical protein